MADIMQMFRNMLPGGGQSNPQSNQLATQFDQNGKPIPNPNQQDPSQIPSNVNQPHTPPVANKTAVEESPLGDFKDFWQTPKDQQQVDIADFQFNFDANKVNQAVSKVDFTKSVKPEQIQAIAKGGEEAVTALLQVVNSVGQQAMQGAIIAGAKVTETGLKTSNSRIASELPNMVRKNAVSNALREDNPLFQNPAIAPMMAAIEDQFASKFPDATPQELKEKSQKYMLGFAQEIAKATGGEFNPNAEKAGNKARQGQEFDFSQWG
jgi:hypothetical protein